MSKLHDNTDPVLLRSSSNPEDPSKTVRSPQPEPAAPPRRYWLRRYRMEVRTDGGWTYYVPAPIALIGIGSLVLAGIFAALDPMEIQAAALDRQAAGLARWEKSERERRATAVASIEEPLRELRLAALLRGIPPEGELARSACVENPLAHFEAHAREAGRISGALAARARAAGSPDAMLPSRSPIDLAGSDFHLSTGRRLPGAVYVSSGKGDRKDPFTNDSRDHKGLDISAPEGTPVVATAEGVVTFAGSVDPNQDHLRGLLGNYVEITHGTSGFRTLYAHLSEVDVEIGQRVDGGTRIGAVGNTGRSTASHLHYQVVRGDAVLDPLLYIADVILVREGDSIRYSASTVKKTSP